jgi:hypothetical protein
MAHLRSLGYALVAVLLIAAVITAVLALRSQDRSQAASGGAEPLPTLAADPPRPVAVFIGDAYSAGIGASEGAKRWTSIVASSQGWEEVNLAHGGSGYLSDGGDDDCGGAPCVNYQTTVADAVRLGAAVVVVAGGSNDQDGDIDAVNAAVLSTYQGIRVGLPSAKIIAVGPTAPEVTADLRAIDGAVERAATAVGATYVSLLDPPVVTAAPLPDGAFVDDEGHAAIADRVNGVLQ